MIFLQIIIVVMIIMIIIIGFSKTCDSDLSEDRLMISPPSLLQITLKITLIKEMVIMIRVIPLIIIIIMSKILSKIDDANVILNLKPLILNLDHESIF